MEQTNVSKSAKVNKKIGKANQTALKGFPKAKIKQGLEAMAQAAGVSDAQNQERQIAALHICGLAHKFNVANTDLTDGTTVLQSWRDNVAVVVSELAVTGNRFVEVTPAKKDQPAKAKLTGYGNNVMSTARGVIEFNIEPLDSYQKTQKAVQDARAEYRHANDPDAAAFEAAVSKLDEAWGGLRKLVVGFKSTPVLTDITAMLVEQATDIAAQIKANQAEQPEIASADTDGEIEEQDAEVTEQEAVAA